MALPTNINLKWEKTEQSLEDPSWFVYPISIVQNSPLGQIEIDGTANSNNMTKLVIYNQACRNATNTRIVISPSDYNGAIQSYNTSPCAIASEGYFTILFYGGPCHPVKGTWNFYIYS